MSAKIGTVSDVGHIAAGLHGAQHFPLWTSNSTNAARLEDAIRRLGGGARCVEAAQGKAD